jgi:flagellar biosynthesis/type III secretory pathway M-ring protein FliF/YscJ
MKYFLKGVITGAAAVLLLALAVLMFRFFCNRNRKIFEYMEAQNEIRFMREDINNRPAGEFLEDPAVRGAAGDAAEEFRRKRDEAIQRIRNGRADRGTDGGGARGDRTGGG